MALPTALRLVEEVERKGDDALDLSRQWLDAVDLVRLIPKIVRLTTLTILDLGANHLTKLPAEIGQLTALTSLNLRGNQLIELPAEIGGLTALTSLDLRENQLIELPAEIGRLTTLTVLDLSKNRLTELPAEIGRLTALTRLDLSGNKLTELPAKIGRLTALTELSLGGNKLTELPAEIWRLTALTSLDISENQLTEPPAEIGRSTALTDQDLHEIQLVELPAEIGRLTSLDLSGNRLTELPAEIWRLTALSELRLQENQLTKLPAETGQLTALTWLDLRSNQLTELPAEIGRLTALAYLGLDGNPLIDPPRDIIRQGARTVVAYFSEKSARGEKRLHLSKLVLVGNADVGKTCTLASLLGRPFNPEEKTTHGMAAYRELILPHPNIPEGEMRLSAWDFGGQQINHATHQFFLTDRALCLLVWDARHDPEMDRLEYWLEMIKTRAPESPIIIVATHLDERGPQSLPLETWRARYPIAAAIAISNKPPRRGIEELKTALARVAAELPLMKATYPANWVEAMKTIERAQQYESAPEQARHYFPIDGLRGLLGEKHDLRGNAFEAMIRWYNDLGGMLYFPEDPELRDVVILNPWLVNRLICQVFVHEDEDLDRGVLTSEVADKIWEEWAREYRPRLIRLMERFDLAYRIPDTDRTLVVDRLPVDPPDYGPTWDAARGEGRHREIAITYRFNAIPAGVPTWFIAREHRFGAGPQWRHGVLLADRERAHYGLLRCDPKERRLDLAVRGPYPANFFALLKHGLELTLERHPGLEVRRAIPCPCGNGAPCGGEFEFDAVHAAQKNGRESVDCPKTFTSISIERLLYGLEYGGKDQNAVLRMLEELSKKVNRSAEEQRELTALVQREFLTLDAGLSREFQALHRDRCPDVFLLRPAERRIFSNPFAQEMRLHLFCQAPGCWHMVGKAEGHLIKEPAKWLRPLAPYLRPLLSMLKTTVPAVAAVAGHPLPPGFDEGIKCMDELVRSVERSPDRGTLTEAASPIRADGAALRNLMSLMKHLDPSGTWDGLDEVRTREGHYLWLCPDHARDYA